MVCIRSIDCFDLYTLERSSKVWIGCRPNSTETESLHGLGYSYRLPLYVSSLPNDSV